VRFEFFRPDRVGVVGFPLALTASIAVAIGVSLHSSHPPLRTSPPSRAEVSLQLEDRSLVDPVQVFLSHVDDAAERRALAVGQRALELAHYPQYAHSRLLKVWFHSRDCRSQSAIQSAAADHTF
jgi:hypothetical protein